MCFNNITETGEWIVFHWTCLPNIAVPMLWPGNNIGCHVSTLSRGVGYFPMLIVVRWSLDSVLFVKQEAPGLHIYHVNVNKRGSRCTCPTLLFMYDIHVYVYVYWIAVNIYIYIIYIRRLYQHCALQQNILRQINHIYSYVLYLTHMWFLFTFIYIRIKITYGLCKRNMNIYILFIFISVILTSYEILFLYNIKCQTIFVL